MVWAGIFGGKTADLFIMNRNNTTPKNGFTAKSYIKILELQLPKYYTSNVLFMQGNAPIYTAKKVTAWFCNNNVVSLEIGRRIRRM